MPMRISYNYALYCDSFTAPTHFRVQETMVVEFYNRGMRKLPHSLDDLKSDILSAIRDKILIPRSEEKLPLVSILY